MFDFVLVDFIPFLPRDLLDYFYLLDLKTFPVAIGARFADADRLTFEVSR